MLVNDWMNTPVITIEATESMARAADLLLENEISILPVLDEGKLVGVVTDRDLSGAPSMIVAPRVGEVLAQLDHLTVEEIMSRNPITVPPDYTLEETAGLMLANNISGCPVVSHEGELTGMITKKDLFRAIIAVTGFPKKGDTVWLLVEDRPGSIKELTDILRKYHARLLSIWPPMPGPGRLPTRVHTGL